jgi:hypothetical protein
LAIYAIRTAVASTPSRAYAQNMVEIEGADGKRYHLLFYEMRKARRVSDQRESGVGRTRIPYDGCHVSLTLQAAAVANVWMVAAAASLVSALAFVMASIPQSERENWGKGSEVATVAVIVALWGILLAWLPPLVLACVRAGHARREARLFRALPERRPGRGLPPPEPRERVPGTEQR